MHSIRMKADKRVSVSSGPFYINTIDQLNEKIASLSVSLEHFDDNGNQNQLVIDGDSKSHFENNCSKRYGHGVEASAFENGQDHLTGRTNTPMTVPAKSSKDVDQFAGVYSFKVVHTSSVDPDSKNTSTRSFKKRIQDKIGMSESHTSLNKRPMLVELHSFPGFDHEEITALPCPNKALEILGIVTQAQMDLERKPSFKNDFTRFFHSTLSQAILQDVFWWFFCHKYQPTPRSQERLFNRIAHNFTKQMVKWIGSRYQDTLLKRYPDLLSQAVYSTFCYAFPTSYRQFDDQFKDELIFLIYQWTVGTKPAPRTYDNWNFPKLEPNGMRKGESLHTESTSAAAKPAFDLQLNEESLGLLKQTNSQRIDPTTSFGHQAHSRKVSRSIGAVPRKTNFLLPSIHVQPSKDSISGQREGYYGGANTLAPSESKLASGFGSEVESRHNHDGVSTHLTTSVKHMPTMKIAKESCKAGKGPGFSKSVFDIYGRSPLVEQFLLAHRLEKNAGTATLVRRTEITNLPPPSAPTYQDIVKESLRLARRLETKYRSTLEENATERARLLKKQKEFQRDFNRRTANLMSNPKEVKRISDLLRLELLRDQNDDNQSWSTQLSLALNKAMGYDVTEEH